MPCLLFRFIKIHTHKHTLGPNEQRKINLKIDSILFAWTVFSFCCCTPLAKGYITFIVVTKIRLQSCNEDRGDDGVKQKKGKQRPTRTKETRRRENEEEEEVKIIANFWPISMIRQLHGFVSVRRIFV